MKIRSNLVLLTLAALLPVAIFAATVGYFLVQQQQTAFRHGIEDRAAALLAAVDAELQGSMDAVEALSLTEAIGTGNLEYFRGTARRVLERQRNWTNINVALPSRERVVDLIAVKGAPLPPITDSGEMGELLKAKGPVVGDLAVGPVSGKWNFGVRVPVISQGEVKYVVSAVVKPDALSSILQSQNVDPNWIAMVLDRQGRIVARNLNPLESVGRIAPPQLVAAIGGAASGWISDRSPEGNDYDYRYQRSKATGWTLAFGIPPGTLSAVGWRASAVFLTGLLAALGLGLGLALMVGRRMAKPLSELAQAAAALGRQEPVAIPDEGRIAEINTLAIALQETADAVREREQRFRALADAAPVSIWMTDVNGQCIWANKCWLDFVGKPLASQLGNGWVENLHNEARDHCFAIYMEALNAREPFAMDFRVRRWDGQYRWMASHGVPRLENGTFAGFVGTCIDIHDRVEAGRAIAASEERLRLALTAGRMGTWEWNVRTNEVIWSPELEAIHGLASGTFAGTFEAYEKDIHPDDREMVRQTITRNLAEGDAHHIEYRIVCPDSSAHWVEGRGHVYRDEGGQPTKVIGVCTDITDRKQVEQALRDADRHKDEFLAMLGHELRNPLAALSTASHVLRLGTPQADAMISGARAVIERQTQHMVRMIDDLLDVARVRWGKLSLDRHPMSLGDLVSEVIQSWRAAGRLAVPVELKIDSRPAWIHADRTRIEQIFSNLLHNALKFTPTEGLITVTVCAEGESAMLRVSDTGTGIPPESLAKLFDPFVQGRQETGQVRSGLGLGLALVQRLTELHGGAVSAESDGIGRGATFTVRLPAIPAAEGSNVETQMAMPGIEMHQRVLVVEDNADVRETLAASLRFAGYEVRTASDGESAIAEFSRSPFDIALLDIGLPGIDGYEVARRIRCVTDAATLIALSGYGSDDARLRAQQAGFDTYLVKPVTPERLREVIGQLRATMPTAEAVSSPARFQQAS